MDILIKVIPLSFSKTPSILQDLAPVYDLNTIHHKWLPGFKGPVPPPFSIRENYKILIAQILYVYKKNANIKFNY